jgi:hypothetical protein
MTRHTNNGDCKKCDEIFDRYPGFDTSLRSWFKSLQRDVPDAHISCAGRGRVDQEDAKKRGASNAHYGESAHNYNLAIDIFRLHQLGAEWPQSWFTEHIAPRLTKELLFDWYGAPGSEFFELPHVQVRSWKKLAQLKLVE